MNKLLGFFLVLFQFVVFGDVAAQDNKADRQRFLDLMQNSADLTKNASYRNSIVVEISDQPDKDWQPYSSMVLEVVFPDRSYLSYKSGREGDFIRIGEYLYSRDQHSSAWIRTEKDNRWVSPPSNPAPRIGVGAEVEFLFVRDEGKGTTVQLVTRPTRDAKRKYIGTSSFSFDERGVLYRKMSVDHNGFHFVRQTENYDYDDTIKIEAPMD